MLHEKSIPNTSSSKKDDKAKNRYVTTPDIQTTQSMAKTPLLSKDSCIVPPSPMSDSLRRAKASSKQSNYVNEDQVDYVNQSSSSQSKFHISCMYDLRLPDT